MRVRALLLAVVAAVLAVLAACVEQGDPAVPASGFSDSFDRAAIGELWHDTGGRYEIQNGQLHVHGAHNHPLWLRRRLPRDCRVEVDARSESPDGDIKVEVFGDGETYATEDEYTASSYVVIFGGWHNQLNVLARLNEHGQDRQTGPRFPVEMGHTYHLKIERRGHTITAWADDHELVHLTDAEPLEGRGHDHFAFNDWEADVWFDNLRIHAL